MKLQRNNTAASRLTPTEVGRIRAQYAKGQTQGSLSREFSVSVVQIGRIVRGEVWQHIPAPGGMLSEGELKQRGERLLGVASGDATAQLAEEFEAFLRDEPKKVGPPPSALDDGEPAAAESAGVTEGLSALQRTAAKYGLDIEQLRSKG